MDFTELKEAVEAIAQKKEATAEELAEVKGQLDEFVNKSALQELATKNADLANTVEELKEKIADMEVKGHYSMNAQTKTFDLNTEVKSLTLANPQADILSKANNEGLMRTDAESAGVTIRTQYEQGIIKPLKERSAFLSCIGSRAVPNEDFKRLVKIKDADFRWGGENMANGTIANTGVQGYAEVTGTYGKAEAYPFITDEMLHDSEFNLVAELSESVLDEIADGIALAALKGDGNKKPKGLMAHTTGAAHEKFEVLEVGATGKLGANTAAAIKALRSIVRALKPGYRANAVWMMNEEQRDILAGFTYADGKSIINEDITEMPEGRLLGKEIIIDPNMTVGEMVFGDLNRGFTLLNVQGMKVLPNPYVAPGNTQFYHAIRVGTIVNDVQAVKIVKIKA
ncbi:phage major capsid protein [Vibrio parahaemolyticus]|nr:phage major capsid protein [Vibrio parahaemolyticus]ELI5414489.1 phage major capsid protein [Vibrio parahaemolyticus]ELI5417951.1 phage major capsid protein [Vibrio parahaemolyticus]ELI5423069.1 phage major capsid protein [Vibrio parahaemolyticus]ELI5426533.1 phage major capsid protein [Vibrio parahaemolyticus]